MKIFRHRGDIYLSKSNYKSSREERILVSLLVVVVAFTIAFLVIMGQRYESIADFIAGDDVSVTQAVVYDDVNLPAISGKTNFLVIETDDEESSIHYAYLIQMDCDNLAYKVSTLNPNMEINGNSLYDLYLSGGGAMVQNELTSYFGFDINFYAVFAYSSMVEFIDSLGNLAYSLDSEINYSNDTDGDSYSIRLAKGNQYLNGNNVSNLMRYYSNEKVNYSVANKIVLYSLTQLFNSENYDKAERLFRSFISNSSTNISVRDFEDNQNSVMVFCKKNKKITTYSCELKYSGNELTQDSIQTAKGYFQ